MSAPNAHFLGDGAKEARASFEMDFWSLERRGGSFLNDFLLCLLFVSAKEGKPARRGGSFLNDFFVAPIFRLGERWQAGAAWRFLFN